ncbi:protein-L-isoaspartate O-methyltransferase [candidate division WWE3 bacterium CG10_big_fil_rev_8_21_14_0_10_48_23]|uniref:Protein-L-isoaspartate O-methyltransferase n=1 Tax=candidate division WWE3 bacterium CG_4_9_14_0_2_um_filter_48_10 TaxID=1975078 RepID=A0A2M8EJF1_UNCKA|nr:MAG: protein-L-isoaspartate O-methyltransferase [candidate division WWE3 bacterium CG_4_9_14_0_2_um_filter_48_10]PJE51665.1 MAG: protein-L-isoaspartate O-methyltransferase [candidate division WWE3 bacterium CG10_big_fil_rev_8_21_14_0_10_48_23]
MADLSEAKTRMLREHLAARGISNDQVLAAFASVPREEFVPIRYRDLSYVDMPLEIGEGQTISQPYTVAFMTQLLDPQPKDIVLEVGTGSGYQAAILAKLVKKVYTIERLENLAEEAQKVLKKLSFNNVEVVVGDGSKGLPEKAPFAGIIITAAAPEIPRPLLEQLGVGGRLVVPVGSGFSQDMIKITKTKKGLEKETHPGFRFVPLVGEHGFKE